MRFLDQWKGFFGEVVGFTETLERLPDGCQCGDSDGHLAERCGCCRGDTALSVPSRGPDRCSDLLAHLRADLSLICQDFKCIVGPLQGPGGREFRLELRRGVTLAASDLDRVLEAFDRVGEAVVGFRSTCAVSDLRQVKRLSALLRRDCEELNLRLSGGGRLPWPSPRTICRY